MRMFETDRGVVQIFAEREERRSEFEPPGEWKLLRRQEMVSKMPDGKEETLFHQRWLHPESRSGIVAFSSFETHKTVCGYSYEHEAAEVYYVVEGYGIGTFDSDFGEIGTIAPIQRSEDATLDGARPSTARAHGGQRSALQRGGVQEQAGRDA
jgi:mannose-6-phosphate isomerase-like protein (cupin superfamily)